MDIGCGPQVCLPHMMGVDAEPSAAGCVQAEADDLDFIADESLDFIFSSHLLEHIEPERVPSILECWGKKLKTGGNLILYLPDEDEYPKVGEEGANADHKWNVASGDVLKVLLKSPDQWRPLEMEKRNRYNEYSLFEVYQKTEESSAEVAWVRNPEGKQRALVFRLGAIGDSVIAAEPLPALKEQGYHITCMTSALGEQVLLNNPHVDEIVVVDKDTFPGGTAVKFFEMMKERYDLIVNLDRSLEGLVLQREENYGFYYPDVARRCLFGSLNYYDVACNIAGVKRPKNRKSFYPSREEIEWAADARAVIEGDCVVWQLAGSAFFKVYPAANRAIHMLIDQGVHVVTTGSAGKDQDLEAALIDAVYQAGGDTSLIHPCAGRWPLRKTVAFSTFAGCVVGPETGVMHALGSYPVPKIMMLSHSSQDNIAAAGIFNNTKFLKPPRADCPCYPCHQAHMSTETCTFIEEEGGALCALSIQPETIYEAITDFLK